MKADIEEMLVPMLLATGLMSLSAGAYWLPSEIIWEGKIMWGAERAIADSFKIAYLQVLPLDAELMRILPFI